ncbi:hypothetical protein EV426DRAFT_711860 [Tirmania nivea]|nr:hypothetical protein EV426DRAFT_711860 [Tirmania nivea]
MSNVLDQPIQNERPPTQAATSVWSLENNSTESPASSANSSSTSVDSYIAGQHRAAAAVREKCTVHIGSGQQTPPPPQDLTYLVTYTKPIQAPKPITPYPRPQGMHFERPAPARCHNLSIHGSISTIDLGEYHDNPDTNVCGFTGLRCTHQQSTEGFCGSRNSCIVQDAPHSEDNREAKAEKGPHDSAQDPPKKHSLGTTTESRIPNDRLPSPPKPKSTIASYVRSIRRSLTPKKSPLNRILSLIPRWLSHRRHKGERTSEPVVIFKDADDGKNQEQMTINTTITAAETPLFITPTNHSAQATAGQRPDPSRPGGLPECYQNQD